MKYSLQVIRSPSASFAPRMSWVTPSPSATIVPMISWPSTPGHGFGRCPRYEWMSERQIVDIRILTSTSPARGARTGKRRISNGFPGAS
jgi:hypothetical protein